MNKVENSTKVICVKVKNIRPQYQNLKEWIEDPNNVYIGRGGIVFIDKIRYPKQNSIWANPFKINKNETREDVIIKYKKYILNKISSDPKTYDLEKLRGKTLGCWCKPEKCHGDILIELL